MVWWFASFRHMSAIAMLRPMVQQVRTCVAENASVLSSDGAPQWRARMWSQLAIAFAPERPFPAIDHTTRHRGAASASLHFTLATTFLSGRILGPGPQAVHPRGSHKNQRLLSASNSENLPLPWPSNTKALKDSTFWTNHNSITTRKSKTRLEDSKSRYFIHIFKIFDQILT